MLKGEKKHSNRNETDKSLNKKYVQKSERKNTCDAIMQK